MDSNTLKYFKIIGKIQQTAAKANTIEEALRKGLALIIKECEVDYVAVWYEDVKGDSVLHPYYWICPVDISFISHKANEGTVGKVYKTQKTQKFLSYKKGDDPYTDKDFKGIRIKSMVTVPLSNKYDKLGSIQFINTTGSKKFSEDDADVFELLTTLIAVGIDEN